MPKAIEPTEGEEEIEAILHAIATAHGTRSTTPPAQVLIGGTALRIAYALSRPSTDLDFLHLGNEDDRGTTEVPEILETMGFKVVGATPDPKIPLRTNIVVRKPGWRNLFGKRQMIVVDDIRTLTISETEIVKREGIWTTNIRTLVELKLNSIEDLSGKDGKRIAARDLYDMAFLLDKHGETFTLNQMRALDAIMEKSVYGTAQERWGRAFTEDPIMNRTSLTEIGDEIVQRMAQYKAQVEQRVGMQWKKLNVSESGKESIAQLKATRMDANGRVNQNRKGMTTSENSADIAEEIVREVLGNNKEAYVPMHKREHRQEEWQESNNSRNTEGTNAGEDKTEGSSQKQRRPDDRGTHGY